MKERSTFSPACVTKKLNYWSNTWALAMLAQKLYPLSLQKKHNVQLLAKGILVFCVKLVNCWFVTVIEGKEFWFIASLKKLKKKKKKSSVQAERGYHEETSQIQGSSQRSLLARTYLQQKVLVQVSSLCRGHVVLSFLLLLKQRGGRNKLQEEDAAFARKRCRREEEEEG